MRKYTDFVFATGGGGAIPGATVTVNISGGGLATLYSDEGITAIENPVLADENGKFEFYVADGSYDISIYDGTGTQTITDVQIYDESTFASSGANGDITSLTGVAGGIASPDYIQFDTGATNTGAVGKMVWNDTDGTLEYQLKGGNVTLQIGQEQVVRVTNDTGSTLLDGQAVYVTGSTGNHLNVLLAQANSEATSSKTLAIVTEHISHNQSGFATVLGLVRDLNTSALTEGAAIWLSASVAGGLTTTRPTQPNHGVFIGWCVRQHASVGSIFVNIQNGYELDELHNVLISGTPLAGSTLIYDATVGVWKNARITAGSNITITNADGAITIAASGGSGSGDVVGPASATNNGVVLYDGTTGKLIKDSGVLLSAKQDALVSGTSIKTVGGVSLLGAGDAGTIGIAYGGTGQTTAANARVALLPSLTGNNGKVLAVNSGQTDVEWIAAGGGSGTVTSVDVSGGTTGLTTSGGPITGSGTITIGGTLDLDNGGTGATTASAARTNLGATTVGANVFTLTNPSAVTFPRFNADNTVSALDAATFRTAIGAGTSSTTGTVTSASVVSANGFAGTVATATTTPAITISTSVTGVLKGNGTAISAAASGTDYVAPSAYASTNGLTLSTARLLGRTTAATGAAEEISIAGGLSLSGGVLTGASGTVTSVAALTLGTTGTDLSSSVATGTTTPVITLNVPTASAANRGALSSTDWSTFNGKQAALTSGTNIKTVNGTSLLGSGDVGTIDIAHGGTGQTTAATARVALLPSLTANAGKVLAVNTGATDAEWITVGGTGTVTSVDVSGGTTGLSFTGGPVTAAGTITASGTLGVANGGTGATALTSGYLVKGNGTSAASASVIYDNGTSIGIGATLPGATGISPFIAIGANNAGIGSASANVLSVVTSNTERMRIHAAGGVSIGTTTDPGANNVTANSFQDGYTTTATAAGTTTLTVASTGMQYFTGATTQTLVLPVTSTLQLGWTYHVANTSTGIVTVQSSGANVIVAIPPGLSVMFTCILTSGTTAASWDYGFTDFPAVTPVGSSSLNDSLFRLNANGAAIGPAIADYFGTNSAVTLAADSVYELEFELFFTKTTAGTVTFTLTSDNAPVNLNAYWIGTAVGGVGTAAASPQAALVASTATAAALPATGSLTTAVNHHYIIKAILNTHATLAEKIRLRVTSSAGTVTPLRGSMYRVRNLTTGNSGTFVA